MSSKGVPASLIVPLGIRQNAAPDEHAANDFFVRTLIQFLAGNHGICTVLKPASRDSRNDEQ